MDRSRITFLLCILLWCGLAAAQTGDPEPTTFTVTQSDYNGTLDADGQAMIASMTTTTNSGYTGTTKLSYIDITGTSCVISNCWMGLTGSVNQMAAGGGAVFGNSGGQVWQLHPSSDTAQGYWTQTNLPLTKYIAVDSDGTLYGLIVDSTCSSWPSTGRLAVANSALTAWRKLNGRDWGFEMDQTLLGWVLSLPAGEYKDQWIEACCQALRQVAEELQRKNPTQK